MQKKVVIICPYSEPSACGIWKRAYNDALSYKNAGYKVIIFSSNIIKATNEKSPRYSNLNGIEVYRFPVILKIGGTAMFWFFQRKLLQLKVDVIHTHGFRHPHSLMSVLLARMLNKKIILTTHAPFSKDPRRSTYLKLMDFFYDVIFSWWELKLYTIVIRVSKWEEKPLKIRGRKNTIYIPNGIERDFISHPNTYSKTPTNRIIYMGRLDLVKRVEWLVEVAKKLPQKHFVLYGPVQGYSDEIIKSWQNISNLEIVNKKYAKRDFIDWVGGADIYVLPSIRESLGITLLEAMSLGKIIITSEALGPKDFVVDAQNGFIVNSERALETKINDIYEKWSDMKDISHNAQNTARKFDAEKLGRELVTAVDKVLTQRSKA